MLTTVGSKWFVPSIRDAVPRLYLMQMCMRMQCVLLCTTTPPPEARLSEQGAWQAVQYDTCCTGLCLGAHFVNKQRKYGMVCKNAVDVSIYVAAPSRPLKHGLDKAQQPHQAIVLSTFFVVIKVR